MVNSILQYIEPQLKAYMQFLNRVDSPVFRISNGEMIKGNGQEKEVVTISDLNGNSLYIRQTQPETINERKALSSCDKEYNISARCKVVFYSFGGNDFTINPDKVKSKIINTLASLDFSHYSGSSTEIKIDVNGTSLDIEKIYTEETGKEFTGNVWPTLVSVDFTLSYVDTNCNTCDIDDSETVVTWTPDLTPENCETKAICDAVAGCQVIKDLQAETASLQEQIDNLPTGGLTCDDLPACQTISDILQSISDIISSLPSSYFSCADLENCQTIIDINSNISDLQTQIQTNENNISDLLVTVQSIINDVTSIIQSLQDFDTALNSHISDNNNPHSTTLQQVVTASPILNDPITSQDGNTYISISNNNLNLVTNGFLTLEGASVTKNGAEIATINDLSTHESNTSNPHQVTLEQARTQNSSLSGDINANSNTIINLKDAVNPQDPITKMQFDSYVSAVGGNRGPIDCSSNPNYPASNKGDRWEVTVAGKIGGPSGINVDVYDEIVCVTASASGDQATVGVNFYIVQGNIERATETTNGYTSYATDAETQSGTNNTKTITPLKLYNWFVALVQSVFVKKGTLTTNYIPKATASDTIGDSSITDDGTQVTVNNDFYVNSGEYQILSDNTTYQSEINGYSDNLGSEVNIVILSPSGPSGIAISNLNTQIFRNDVNPIILSAANVRVNNLTASQIVATDASKNLQSLDVATYPSLTELAYIKGLTSAIQAQIDAKLSTPTPTDYSATSTINGFSSFTTKIIQVINMGAYDLINYDIGGTSNATTLSFTVPNALSASAPAVSSIMHSLSGATNGSGLAQLAVGATQVNCFLNVSSGSWTASGTKRVRGTIIVQK